MKTIRESMFETNSSSTHCVSIANNVEKYMLDQLANPTGMNPYLVVPYDGYSYGEFTTVEEKLAYISAYMFYETKRPQLLIEVFKEQTGLDLEVHEKEDEYGYFCVSWDDRCCWDEHQDKIGQFTSDKEDIRQFIFNPGYTVLVNHD